VYLSSAICNRLMQFEAFSMIGKYTSSRYNMLTAACATGIIMSLGTPIGGVLFSIEALSSTYIMSNIWKSFFCAIISLIISKLLGNYLFLSSISNPSVFTFNIEIVLFLALGVISGIIGFILNNFIGRIVYLRRKSGLTFLQYRFRYTLIIAITIVLVTYFIAPLRLSDQKMVNHLFQHNGDNETDDIIVKDGFSLLTILILKTILFILSMTLDIPGDVFTTIFCIGGLFGRLFGHYAGIIFTISDKTIYSMVGAAAVFSGSTQTVSAAVIIFEITGQSSYLPPLLLATIIANLTSQSLSMSIYDVLLAIKNLPSLSNIKGGDNKTAIDLMSGNTYSLDIQDLKVISIMEMLSRVPRRYECTIPLIDENGILRYTANILSLSKYLQTNYEKIRMSYNIVTQKNFTDYFASLRRKFIEENRSLAEQIKHKIKKLYTNIRERVPLNKTTEEELNHRIFVQMKEISLEDDVFLNSTIDVNDPGLLLDKSTLGVDINFPIKNIQFLFTRLNISHVYVTNLNKLCGIITKEDFIKKSIVK
jgi:hypothetical protein